MRKIFAWATAGGAEQHFRFDLPFSVIDADRFEITVGTPGPDIHDYDVVFVHRLAGIHPVWNDLCADPDVLAIYDMDDDLLRVDPDNALPYRVFAHLASETRRNVEQADIVTVSSVGLFDFYKTINPNVVRLPICVPDDHVLPFAALSDRLSRDRDELVVGWGGSMHKAQDWAEQDVAGHLARFATECPSARFVTMGGDYTRGLLPQARHEHLPFTTVRGFYDSIDRMTVGLAPLKHSPFNEGKCHTKLIEYGARGVPTIATNIAEYADWIQSGYNGLLVDEADDWRTALHVMADPDARERMRYRAWRTAANWAISKHVWRWQNVFEGKVS